MKLHPEVETALKAHFQWETGDSGWAQNVIDIIGSDDPIGLVQNNIQADSDEATAAEVIEENR